MRAQPSAVVEVARGTLRLAVKPEGSSVGYVDGAWWPWTRDLSAELPSLLTALAARLGRCERVTYNLTAWGPVARRLVIDGRVVRLEGFRSQHPNTLTVVGTGGQRRATLLVVPPETEFGSARRALATAAQPGNTDSVDDLLRPVVVAGPDGADGAAAATQRWEAEGGSVRTRASRSD